jgi:hypothetical protein
VLLPTVRLPRNFTSASATITAVRKTTAAITTGTRRRVGRLRTTRLLDEFASDELIGGVPAREPAGATTGASSRGCSAGSWISQAFQIRAQVSR